MGRHSPSHYSKRSPLRRLIWFGCLVWLCLPLNVLGQTWVEAGFEREVNRYRWTSDAMVQMAIGRWQLETNNTFRSDAYLLFDDRLSFRNENRFSFRGQRPTSSSKRQFVTHGNADWFSLSRVLQQGSWVGMRWTGDFPIWIEPTIGLAIDARPGFGTTPQQAPVRTDIGPGFGVSFGLPRTDINGYALQASGKAVVQRTSPRVGRLLKTDLYSDRRFESTRIQTRLAGSSVRRDAYQSASFLNRDDAAGRKAETVESTRSDTLDLQLLIDSRVSGSFLFSGRLDISTNSRSVRTLRAPSEALFFDSNFNRRIVEGSVSTSYSKGQTLARLSVRLGAEVERRQLVNADDLPSAQAAQKLNLLRQADNDRGYISLQQTVNAQLRPWWQLQMDASANILRHDTPQINPDDRDELFYNTVLGSRFRLAPELTLMVQVFGSWFHTVYIKAARSAENNIQRSLRYRPALEWNPNRKTRIRYTNEVRATYTVDDFLLPGRRPTDQSAREMRHEIQASRAIGSTLTFEWDGSYSDLRLGRFLNESFAEIPIDTLRTYSGWLRVRTGKEVQVEVGVRYYIRSDFDRSVNVRYTSPITQTQTSISRMGRTRIDQIGPTTSIHWNMRRNAFIRLDGWAVRQRVSHALFGSIPEELESVVRSAAKKGRTSIIPNMSLTMRWSW